MRLFRKRGNKDDSASKDDENGSGVVDANVAAEQSSKESEDMHRAEVEKRQQEISEIKEKYDAIKEEYEVTVSNLMLVKKELNQKRIELEVAQREYKETREKNKKVEMENHLKLNDKFYKTEEQYAKIKEELKAVVEKHDEVAMKNEQITKSYNEITERYNEVAGKNDQILKEYDASVKKYDRIKQQMIREQNTLSKIKKQQAQIRDELKQTEINEDSMQGKQVEAGSKMSSTQKSENKEKIDGRVDLEQSGVADKKLNESQQSAAGVIKAASVVVGSMKAKLKIAQKELETLQAILKKEREAHEKTKAELRRMTAVKTDEA